MPKKFPHLSVFMDISGRLIREKTVPIVVGGIAIPSSEVNGVRESLLACTGERPSKWSDSSNNVQSAKSIARLMAKRQLTATVWIIRKDTEEWEKYWNLGNEIYETGVKKAQEPLPFAKPAATLKFHLYGIICAHLFGIYARRYKSLLSIKSHVPQKVTVSVICDSDIQGEANEKVFRTVLEKVDLPRTEAATNLRPTFKVSLMTEQDEPLLLLPDHLAGFFYSSDAYGQHVGNERNHLLQAVKHILSSWPDYALDVREQAFREDYLAEKDVFGQVIPKRAREKLIQEMKASGRISADWSPDVK